MPNTNTGSDAIWDYDDSTYIRTGGGRRHFVCLRFHAPLAQHPYLIEVLRIALPGNSSVYSFRLDIVDGKPVIRYASDEGLPLKKALEMAWEDMDRTVVAELFQLALAKPIAQSYVIMLGMCILPVIAPRSAAMRVCRNGIAARGLISGTGKRAVGPCATPPHKGTQCRV